MGQTARAADAAAHTGHALNEVHVDQALGLFQQGELAFLNAVAGHGLELEVLDAVLLEPLCHSLGQTTAAGKDAAKVGRAVQRGLGQRGDVDIPAVKQGLQLFKGERGVHPGGNLGLLDLGLLGRAGADKDHLGLGLLLLEVFGDGRHGRQRVGNIGHKLRIVLFHKAHKGRAAGGEQEALLGKLLRLVLGHHIGAERGFDHVVEAEPAQARDHLAKLRISKLAGDGGRHHGIDLAAEDQALLQHIHHLDDLADVGDGAEGTGIDASAAGDALLIVDIGGLVLFGGH